MSNTSVAERDLYACAERQHGLVTTAQASAALTPGQLNHRRRTGRLAVVRTGVMRVAGAPETWEQRLLAAVLAGGRGSVASFRAAAALWGLEGLERRSKPEITVPSERRARLPGVVVHDSMMMPARHRARRDGIPVTNAARTVCDLTAVFKSSVVERALDDALRRDLTHVAQLERVFLDLAHRGRRKSTVMRAIVEARLPGFDPGDSPMELKLIRWIVEAGLPRPVQQHPVVASGRKYRLDLAYPDLRIGIEYDGWDSHRIRRAFDGDRARQNPLEILGWLILRYTSRSTRQDVVAEVRAAISARRHIEPTK